MSQSEANPLLQECRLPPFSQIQASHIVPAIQTLTQQNLTALEQQLQSLGEPDWKNLAAPLEAREDRLSQAWAPVSHLNSVANTPELRQAFEQAVAVLTGYNTAMGQNEKLYASYKALRNGPAFKGLRQAQRQAVDNALRDFELAGVGLDASRKARYGQIKTRLSELSNRFSNNVLDATQAWNKHVVDEQELAGLPPSAVAAAKQAATTKGLSGWVLTLDGPVYLTVMTQADNRDLRREMYTAYMTRASDQGPNAGEYDNAELIDEILSLRAELAQLLGFANYAELSLAPKMAKSPEQVVNFLRELAEKSKPVAAAELEELQAWSKQHYGAEQLEVWDIPYYSEKLREAKYSVSQEALRPYFTLPKVLDGLFAVAGQLFGIQVEAAQQDELWHTDAKFFNVLQGDRVIAQFYLDLFAREGKRGGAWMAECRVRRQTDSGLQIPVAFMVCNFNAPVDGKPALLTHSEVTTLFHEFGHGLHHLLTQVDVAAVSGINGVAWDAVELPSQFMENWCWQRSVLKQLTAHVDTGEPLPEASIDNLIAAKNFQSALMMMRQIEFALFDLLVHMHCADANFEGVQAQLDAVRQEVAVVQPPAFNRFQHGFSHIFAGGYAAGYYSYKWAEVLSADAFSAFEENGLFDQATGQKFLQEILQKGGSQDAMALFQNFRGREPQMDALLRHSGISR